jgi:2'-hydroxyisoflavone reductase
MNREILIIGGTGFIGAEICKAFLSQGDTVTLFHRNLRSKDFQNSNVTHLLGARESLPDSIKGHGFDIVVDTCGFKPDDFSFLNSLVTQHYIFISSVAVYSTNIHPFSTEDGLKIEQEITALSSDVNNLNKHQQYALQKFASEKYIRENFENSSIVRPSVVLGAKENSGRLEKLITLPKVGCEIPLKRDRKFQFIDVFDLASLFIKVAGQPPGEDYNLVGPSVYWQEFVETFLRVFEIKEFSPGQLENEFPFWDQYANAGIRSLTSKYSWIRNHEFSTLSDSLERFRLDYYVEKPGS